MKFAQFKFISACALSCALLVGLSGCGGGGVGSTAATASAAGKASFKIKWPKKTRVIPSGAACIVINLQSQFTPVETQTSGPLLNPGDGSTITWTSPQLDVGTWTVSSTAYPNADGSGTPLATASVPVTISSSAVSSVNLTMLSTASKVVVAGPASLLIGSTGTYTATVYDSSNDVLMENPSTINWLTSSPSTVALSPSAGASVTGTAGTTAGSATLSATFSEVDGSQTAPVGSLLVNVVKTGGGGGGGGKVTNFWTQFDGNLQNTGRSAEPTPVFSQIWRLPLTAARHASSGVLMDDNGIVYMLNQTGAANSWIMYAIDPINQAILWQNPVTFPTNTSPKMLLSSDGVLYLAGPGGIQCFTTADGHAAGTFSHANTQNSFPVIGKDNLLYWGADNALMAIDRSSLTVTRTFTPAGKVSNSIAFDPDGTLYVADSVGTLYSLNSASFTVNWTFNNNLLFPVPFVGGPAVMDNGTIVIGATNNVFHYIYKATGFEQANYTAQNPIESTPSVGYDGTVFFADNAGTMYALGARQSANGIMGTQLGINFPAIVFKDGGVITFNNLTSTIDHWVYVASQSGPGTWELDPRGAGAFGTFGGVGAGIAPGNNMLILTDGISSVYALK